MQLPFRLTALFFLLTVLVGCVAPAPAAVAPAAPANSTTVAAPEPVTIPHALGESTITGIPQRIVALEWTYVENLLALGIQPVGVADMEGYTDWVKVPIALDPSVVDVGERGEPNLETLTGLKPDLIITAAFRSAENYEQLSAIAPTIAFDSYPTDERITQYDEMRQTFRTIADLVGRTTEGEAVLAQMEAKFAAARSQLEAAGKLGESFVLAQAFGGDTVQIRLFTDNAMATEIVTQLGLENGWNGPFDQYGFTTVSIETLPELGDVNFFYVVQDDNDVFTREAIAPLWNELTFVQNDNAYPLGGDTWLFGGPLSAELVVDKVMEALTGEPVTVESAPAEAATTDSCDPGYRLFTHADIVGKAVCIPEQPAQVVTLEPFYALQMAVKLGLPLIATAAYGSEERFPTALSAEETAGIAFAGAFDQPNLETITQLAPDLIIGDAYFQSERYDLLSAIAPTVLINTADWKTWYMIIAEVGGATAQATEEMAAYDARVAEIGARLREGTVSFVRVVPGGFQLYREAPNAYAPIAVMTEVGVVRPDFEVGTDETSWEQLDWEGIVNLTGNVLFYVVGGADDEAPQLEAEVTANPIWQQLPAVQAGRAYRVNAEQWMSFGGLHSAHAVLDDLEEYLAE
jgi:iron complex transport system substrate-binding protein